MSSHDAISCQLTVSDRAAGEIRTALANEPLPAESRGLRVGVRPGGCSGFRYALETAAEPAADDVVVECHGIRFFVDPFSAPYLNGTTIDYQSSLEGSGFAFQNPNAGGRCGCGQSFGA